MLVCFEHTNNGGYYWLSDNDWDALAEAGWLVRRDIQRAWITAGSVEAAKRFWSETLTHFDPNDDGCECCSAPFRFDEEDEPGWWNHSVWS